MFALLWPVSKVEHKRVYIPIYIPYIPICFTNYLLMSMV